MVLALEGIQMGFTSVLSALVFRAAAMLLDLTAVFLVIRILCEVLPGNFLHVFDHLGRPLIDRVISMVQQAARRLGLAVLQTKQACLAALALLCVLQIVTSAIIGWSVTG